MAPRNFSSIINRIGMTDKNTYHTYGPWYDKWFKPIQNDTVNILEIGVSFYGGGSILALADYFKNGIIYGIDNNLSRCSEQVKTHPRVILIEADAYKSITYKIFKGVGLDVIIDDCIHSHKFQMRLLKLTKPYLKGFYVIEDIAIKVWNEERLAELKTLGFKYNLINEGKKKFRNNGLIRLDRVC